MATTKQVEQPHHPASPTAPEGTAARHQAEMLAFSQIMSTAAHQSIVVREAAAAVARALDLPIRTISKLVEGGRELQRSVRSVSETTGHLNLDDAASADAYAMSVDAPVVIEDLTDEERFCDESLRAEGVLSGVCVHLFAGSAAIGCIGAYDTRRRDVSDDDVNFVTIISSMASSALARIHAEDGLIEAQALAAAMLDSSPSLMLVLDHQQRIVRMNAACQRVSEFTLDEVKTRSMSSVMVVPEEYEKISALFRKAKTASEPIEFDSHILTKRGERRRVTWSLTAAQQGAGGETSLVLTGVCHGEANADTRRAFDGSDDGDHAARPAGDDPSAPVGKRPAVETKKPATDMLSIAPYSGGVAPAKSDFFSATYREISAGGVTFQLSQKPDFESLVIALGNPAQPTLLTAQVARVQSMIHSGKVVYLVGCRFTGRLSRP